jgi:hypothetical protein
MKPDHEMASKTRLENCAVVVSVRGSLVDILFMATQSGYHPLANAKSA